MRTGTPLSATRLAVKVPQRRMQPLSVGIAVALHLVAIGGLITTVSPRLPPDEVPIALTLEFSSPAMPEAAPSDSSAAAAPSPPEAPPQVPTILAPEPADPTPPLPDATPPPSIADAVPLPPVVAPPSPLQVTKPKVEVPSPTVFRRPPHPVEPTRPETTRHPRSPTTVSTQTTPALHAEPSAASVPAPSPQLSPPPQAAEPTSDPAWSSALSGWLQGHRPTYPETSRRRGEQGAVGLRFTVLRDGHVQDATIIRPSGIEALDSAALTTLQGARVPEFPASMPKPSITVTVTLRFSLTK